MLAFINEYLIFYKVSYNFHKFTCVRFIILCLLHRNVFLITVKMSMED